MTNKQLQTYQKTFEESFERFSQCIEKLTPLNEDQNKLIDLMKYDWKSRINDENWMRKFDRIKNFQSLLGFKSELSFSLSFEQLVDKVGQNMAEIDIAIHLLREFPETISNKKIHIEKLLETTSSICDFVVSTTVPHYIESKYVKTFSEGTVRRNTEKALSQIKNTGKENDEIFGVVWIFTYDQPDNPREVQAMVENVQRTTHMPFKYLLNVQVYGRDLYGEANFRLS